MTAESQDWTVTEVLTEPTLPYPVPWEDPRLPGLTRLFTTLQEVLFRPQAFFRGLSPQGSQGQPFAFGLLVGTAGLACYLFWSILLRLAAESAGRAFGAGPGPLLVLMAASPLLVAVGLAVAGCCFWGAVAAGGGSREFTPAWRVLNYAQAAMALGVIPIFGMPLAAIWSLVILYYGISQVFGCSGPRTIATLVLFIVLKGLVWLLILGSLVLLVTLGGFLFLLP